MKNVNQPLRILFIFADSSVKKGLADADELQRLMQGAADAGHPGTDIDITYMRSLSFFVGNNGSRIYDHRNKRDIKEYDFVYFRKVGSVMQQALACAIYLRQHGVPFFDVEIGRATSRNKLSQMFMMHEDGLSIPTTFFCRNRKRLIRLLSTRYAQDFVFPVIAKATGGTRGDANYLVKSLDELKEIVEQEKRHFLIQSFVPNDGDYRVLVVNEEVRGIIKRTAVEGSHLNNTSKQGSANWLPLDTLDASTRMLAIRAAQACGRSIAGVDIILDKENGTAYILEVNRAPQIEHASFPEEKAKVVLDGIIEAIQEHDVPSTSEDAGKLIIGRKEHVSVVEMPELENLIAKVDTGAYTSSLHCPYVEEKLDPDTGKRILLYSPFEDRHTIYQTEYYFQKTVTSSNGIPEERYVIELTLNLGGRQLLSQVSLTDRSGMLYPMLIGRKFLKRHKILVNVAKRFTV